MKKFPPMSRYDFNLKFTFRNQNPISNIGFTDFFVNTIPSNSYISDKSMSVLFNVNFLRIKSRR